MSTRLNSQASQRRRRALDACLLLGAIALLVASGGLLFRALVDAPSDAGFAALYVVVPVGLVALVVLIVVLARVATRQKDG